MSILAESPSPLGNNEVSRRWLVRPAPRIRPLGRLVCFSFAGGGASAFRLWPKGLPPELELIAVQPPGRENRIREAPLASITATVEALLPALSPYLDVPFAFFGHSMGGVVATETAHALARQGAHPRHLVVSAAPSPHWPDLRPPLRGLPDREFIAEINRRYGGIPSEVARDADLMALLLPMLRADITALETYRPPPRAPLSCPITVFGGLEDSQVGREQLEVWRRETTGPVRVRVFPGGHFYLEPQRGEVLADLTATLAPLLAPARYEGSL